VPPDNLHLSLIKDIKLFRDPAHPFVLGKNRLPLKHTISGIVWHKDSKRWDALLANSFGIL